MIYLPRSRVERRHGKKMLWLVLVFILGALLFSWFDNLIIKMVSPLWRAENSFSRSLLRTGEFFKTRDGLIEENTALKEKLVSLELELSTLSSAQAEKEKLLNLLGRQVDEGGITVSVLTHPPQSPYDLLVIDAGERSGVTVGARVYLPEGPEVGVVTQVFPSFSRMKLLSTSGERTQAVLERHEVPVELIGLGGGNFQIVLPRETVVEVGDKILSGYLNPSMLAVVGEVSLEPTDSFKEVLAKGPANIFTLRFLTVRP